MLNGQLQTNSVTYQSTTTTSFLFEWSATQSGNTSTITWTLTTVQTPTGSGYYRTVRNRYVEIDGDSTSATSSISASNGTQILSGSKTLTHNADGTKTFTVNVGVAVGGTSYNCTATGSFTLKPTITIAKINSVLQVNTLLPNANSNRVPVNMLNASNSYNYKLVITYATGRTITKSLSKDNNNNYYLNFTTAELSLMFNTFTSTQVNSNFNIALETYNGNTKLGQDTATSWWNMQEADLTRPEISGTITATEQNSSVYALTGGSKFIKSYSNALITFTKSSISLKYNATLSHYLFNNSITMTTTGSGSTYEYNPLETSVLQVQAVDSRGYRSYAISNVVDLITNYTIPTITNFSLERDGGVGTTAHARFNVNFWNGNFGNGNNAIQEVKYYVKEASSSTWSSSYDCTSQYDSSATTQNIQIYSDGTSGAFTLGTAYDIKFIVKDGITNHTFNTSLEVQDQLTDGRVLDGYHKTSTGYQYGINQIPDTSLDDGLQVNGELYLNGYKIHEVIGDKTNNNDICIKFDNGLMICHSKKVIAVDISTQLGSMYRDRISDVFTFPSAFVSQPNVFVSTANNNDYIYASVYGVIRNLTGITSVDLIRPVTGSGNVTLHYIAIGFWK